VRPGRPPLGRAAFLPARQLDLADGSLSFQPRCRMSSSLSLMVGRKEERKMEWGRATAGRRALVQMAAEWPACTRGRWTSAGGGAPKRGGGDVETTPADAYSSARRWSMNARQR